MNSQIEGIGTLEKPIGTLKILVHLRENKKATITNLIQDVELNQRTTYSALENLQNQGLIFQEKTNGFPVCKYYKLTEKGDEVAYYLDTVACLLTQEHEN